MDEIILSSKEIELYPDTDYIFGASGLDGPTNDPIEDLDPWIAGRGSVHGASGSPASQFVRTEKSYFSPAKLSSLIGG